MSSVQNRPLRTGELLIRMGVLSQAQLDIGLLQQKALLAQGKQVPIGEILVHNRFISKHNLALAMEHATEGNTSGSFRALLPVQTCQRHEVIPVSVENHTLVIRAARRLTDHQKSDLQRQCEVPVSSLRIIPSDRASIRASLSKRISQDHSFAILLNRLRNQDEIGSILKQAIDAMLAEALDCRASDIHLDRKPDPDSWVSYRIDGTLHQKHLVPERLMSAIITRLKTEGGMDASDSRRPQDGRMSIQHRDRMVEFRIASQPIAGGETIEIRVLDSDVLPTIHDLFPNQLYMVDLFNSLARSRGKSGGIVLFTGPTGSGKTSSMYALGQMLPRERINVMTVEDPVEYPLPFARQIQLNQLLGEQAVDLERSILRQDPDVLILGEIRDGATAKAATRFAETGHRVIATLHTKTVLEVFERLMSMVDENSKDDALYVLAQHLQVVVNQQLVRRLCSCADEVPSIERDHALSRLPSDVQIRGHITLKKRRGCPRCDHSGYYGRIAAHETLVIDREPSVRSELLHLLSDGLKNSTHLPTMKGVTYLSRRNTLGRLLEAGLIDVDTALEVSE